MSFREHIQSRITEELWARLTVIANAEVSLALQHSLTDSSGQRSYYRCRNWLPLVLQESCECQRAGLRVSPTDIVNILFRCKLLFAVASEDEYRTRAGGSWLDREWGFLVPWEDRSKGCDVLVDEYFDRLETFVGERTIVTVIDGFEPSSDAELQRFFNNLFSKIGYPFTSFVDTGSVEDLYRKWEPHRRQYTKDEAIEYFHLPAIGYSVVGSECYSYWAVIPSLRAMLSLLRIAGFLFPGQMTFGSDGVSMSAPLAPVVVGSGACTGLCWNEDEKEPWERMPDGCLVLSFGYRGYSKMCLDSRTYKGIETFIVQNKGILCALQNPWELVCIDDIAPILDIMSSVTQVDDLGAKILLLYCCLEHLFVPEGKKHGNKECIEGGITALAGELLPWFERLYSRRCDYAHKGYVKVDSNSLQLVRESIVNVMKLLSRKVDHHRIE